MSFEAVLRNQQSINALARSLIGRPAFEDVRVLIPNPERPEPAFIRATSWLYCLYFEAGAVSIFFLRRLGEAYSLVDRVSSDYHVETVRSLRTELHHNLGFADSDQAARTTAECWRRKACGTALPRDDVQWLACYERLVGEAAKFLGDLDAVVRRAESDGESAEEQRIEWTRRLARSWPASAFDELVDDAKYRLGREMLKTVTFRNRHIEKWRRQLELLDDGFDFEFEATRLIERTLLQDDMAILPITGRDIIDALGIKPGPEVGALLREARRFFEANGCGKDAILAHLRDGGLNV